MACPLRESDTRRRRTLRLDCLAAAPVSASLLRRSLRDAQLRLDLSRCIASFGDGRRGDCARRGAERRAQARCGRGRAGRAARPGGVGPGGRGGSAAEAGQRRISASTGASVRVGTSTSASTSTSRSRRGRVCDATAQTLRVVSFGRGPAKAARPAEAAEPARRARRGAVPQERPAVAECRCGAAARSGMHV